MNIRNCKSCGRIFNYVSGPVICPICKESAEAKFQEVKDYIRENKGASINEVAEACDVDPAQIRQWLREDRLEVTPDSAITLSCDNCGASIRSGKFCEKCKNSMARNLSSVLDKGKSKPAQPQKKDEDGPRMRFLK